MASNNKKRDFSKTALSELFQKSRGLAERFLRRKNGTGPLSIRRRLNPSVASEQLEIRALLSTFMVTSTADSGAGSLRQAIDDANLNNGADSIEFNIAGAGPHTIAPMTDLPTLTESIIIDARTQTGYAGSPLIQLDGQNSVLTGLAASGASTSASLRGLSITGFTQTGITIALGASGDIRDSYIGLLPDGTTAAGNGVSGPSVEAGIWLQSGNLTVVDNVVSGNMADAGVYISGGGTVSVRGNRIGTNAAGTAAIGNAVGIYVDTVNGAVIGGSGALDGNLISGNTTGIRAGVFSVNTVIAGNLIGLNAAGLGAIPNTTGISVDGQSARIGTDGEGLNDEAERNVISGNTSGIVLIDSNSHSNVISGNYIGTNLTGTAAIGNSAGIVISGGAYDNIIGGDSAAERNVISGNNGPGIDSSGAGTGTVVTGNYFGVNAAGTSPLPNYSSGNNAIDVIGSGTLGGSTSVAGTGEGNLFGGMVRLTGAASTVQGNTFGLQSDGNTVLDVSVVSTQSSSGIRTDSNGHLIGGTTAGLRNVFAGAGVGNFNGNSFIDLFSDNNTVQGNYLGTGLTGLEDRSNAERGVSAHGSNNLIGGTTTDARNVVVGSYRGIEFNGPGNTALGNYVGLGADGSTMLGNETWGIFVRNPGSTVGGDIAGAGNVVAGSLFGVRLEDTATGTIVAGNFIGTDATGMLARPNQTGLSIGTSNNIIGGTTADARNIISGNTETGVSMSSSGNRLEGNYIGVDATGNALLGAARINVATSGANTIGGLTTTPGTSAGNVIAGATGFNSANISSQNGATIQGNIVGLGANGSTDLSSGAWNNVLLAGQNNLVGGAVAGARNVLGGGTYQINMMDGYNTVQGNYIGTDASGMLSRNSTNHGIVIGSGSHYNQIGGTSAAARNIISGNAGVGIYLSGNSNTIQGNWVGLNAAGTALPNSMHGVFLFAYSGPSDNLIGGTAPGAGNVISGNTFDGIQMQFGQNNSVQGNRIGTDPTGSSAIANGGHGIAMYAGANSSIGGAALNAGNLISGNAQAGIYLISHPSIGDTGNITIQGNFLGTDASGITAIPNAIGVQVVGGAHDISIGGATSSAGNVISGNTGVGVLFSDATTINNSVRGNLIGVKADGTTTLVNGGGAMSVTNGASLKGTGSFTGNVVNQGTVAPGNSPGIITINGNYTQSSNATLEMELEGINAAVPEFDQLIVNGTVSLNGILDVSLLNDYRPSLGSSFRIIDNDGSDAITGTFNGLAQDAIVVAAGRAFTISYTGGTGNDVVLTAVNSLTAGALTPPPATEGQAFSNYTIFHFSDITPGATVGDYLVTVNTGEGALTNLANPANVQVVANLGGGFDVKLSYTYALQLSNGAFSVTVVNSGGDGLIASIAASVPGTLDTSFGSGGVTTTQFLGNESFRDDPSDLGSTLQQPDGKIIVVGYSYTTVGTSLAMSRYNVDGSLDSSFGSGGKVLFEVAGTTWSNANNAALQADGKIVVAGSVLARFNSNGSLDTTFANGAGWLIPSQFQYSVANQVAVQSDGKIVVSGNGPNGRSFVVSRYNDSGSPDTSFGTNGTATVSVGSNQDSLNSMVVQTDGAILLAGYSYQLSLNIGIIAMVRLDSTGALDASFGSGGIVTSDLGGRNNWQLAQRVLVQPDGKILIAGSNADLGDVVARYQADGTLDTSFGTGGLTSSPDVPFGFNSLALQPDGSILAGAGAGGGNLGGFAVSRFNNSGILDTSFGTNGTAFTVTGHGFARANGLVLQADGKIVAVGSGQEPNPTIDFTLVRYTTAGVLDNSFGSNGQVRTNFVRVNYPLTGHATSVVVQPDGRTLVAGTETGFNRVAVTRYNADGTLDNSFGTSGIFKLDVTGLGLYPAGYAASGVEILSMTLQADGRIVVAGKLIASYGGNFEAFVARINANGTLDTSFDNDGYLSVGGVAGQPWDFHAAAKSVVTLADGTIVIAGEGRPFNDRVFGKLFAFNSDGSLKTGFGTGGQVVTEFTGQTSTSVFNSLAVQADGKLIAVGQSLHPGVWKSALARYNADGSLDTTFGSGGQVQSDGSPFGAGVLWFIPESVVVQSDGSLLVSGYSDTTTGQFATLARYTSSGVLDATFGTNGAVISTMTGSFKDVTIQANGRIVATSGLKVARFSNSGVLETGFGTNGITTVPGVGQFSSVTTQPDGNIVAAGYINGANGSRFAVARINAGGYNVADANIVTTTTDSIDALDGIVSLREAITIANARTGVDQIAFNISGSGVFTISPASALPTITETVILDGTTQPGFAGAPAIELSGVNAGVGVSGLTITGSGSTIRGLIINRFGGSGIVISGSSASSNVIAGNYIGTDATGLLDLGNGVNGVDLIGAHNNIVGGTTAADRNVISGNNVHGVRVLGADGNTILGNYVGLGADGSTIVANSSNGIYTVFASNTTIGGSTAGARNVVSGNLASGIAIDTGAGSVVSGNYVGLTADGTAPRMNAVKGISLAAMTNATVGGLTTESRNVVVSNDGGIKATQGSHGTQILGNYVGTNAAGTVGLAVATDRFGIEINDSSNITVGGGTAGARNVILTGAGSYGVFVTNSSGLMVQGNLIGLDVTGENTSASSRGILLANVSATIGTDGDGTNDAAEGNVIAGASINIDLQGTAGTIIAGNLIGTNAAGTAILGTSTAGIRDVSAGSNRIGSNADGTSDAFERNIIAGATSSGIHVTAPHTVIAGNFIGTNAAGDAALGNANGVQIHGSNINIGGSHAASRNVISGNTLGLNISAASTNNTVAGNYIGTNAAGTAALSNTQNGVYIAGTNNVIGGTTSGARNVISGNDRGVLMDFASNNTVQGNYIGTDYTGLQAIGNGVGVEIKGFGAPSAVGNVIGGSVVGAGNVISGNGIGVGLEGNGVANNTIAGNLIGLGVDGSTIVTNGIGVQVNNSHDNTIGGTTVAARNIISGNIAEGIILNYGAYENTISGNYIGLDRTGTTAKPNNIGILVNGPDNVIGGTSAGTGNVISGNMQDGVLILNGISGTEIEGNYIGTSADGTSALGNGRDGIQGYVLSTTIARNVISGNARHGIDLGGESNAISGNFVGTNATGTAAIQNGAHGISSYSNNSIIGGFTPADRNIIVSGNAGVSLSSSFNTRVSGNYIGTDVTGTQVLASGNPVGVSMFGHPAASNITIGGGEPGAGNVINVGTVGNGIGVHIQHTGGSGNKVQGNFIGTDPTGSFRVGNNWGVLVDWQNGVVIGTDSNGSNDATEGNVVSGNVNGIMFGGFGGGGITGTVIAGNKIGTDKTGTRIIGNTNDGMQLNSYGSTRVGTDSNGISDEFEGNIIAGSGRAGIWFTGDNNVIAGNFIGTDTTETIALPNTYGIIAAYGTGHTIGGVSPIARNVIANSSLTGLKLEPGTSNTGTFINNSFFGNLSLAIDAGAIGRTVNDVPDLDDLLNYPVITSTLIVGNEMIVTGTMPAGKTVELYISAPSSNGVGQGRTRLASVLDDSAADEDNVAGQFRIRIPIGTGVNHGTPLTTLTLGSISEFSPIVFAGEVGSFLAPQITLSQSTVSITSGNAIDVEGSFYDPDSVSWEATVDYGDGSGVRPLTLNANNSFRLLHTYPTTGNYTITVVIRDTTLISSTKTLNVVVQNESPTATFNEFTITSPANEGQLVTLTGRFEDTAGTHTATIQWGDGQTSSVVIVPGSREFNATHVYADDSNPQGTATPSDVYRVIVTITDETGANDTTPVGLFLEEIRNVLPSGLSVAFSSTSVLEGQAVSLSGLFTDPGMVDVHRVKVNWGDGTESLITLPVGARSFAGLPELTHVYKDDQNTGVDEYIVTVEVADDDEPQKAATMSQVIALANALPSPVNASLNANVISENGIVALSGTFSDLGLADSHEITVIWGDGSTPSAFSLLPGVVSFAGLSHQYQDNSASGSYTIEIRVADNDDPETYVSSFVTVYVQNIAPVVSPLLLSTGGSSINEGDSVTVSGSYSDTSPDDHHTVFVNWGDGTVSEAIVDLINRTFTATHRYLDNNGLPIAAVTPESTSIHNYLPYTITVSVDDQDGGIAAASVNQDVFNVAPVVEILPDAANSNPNLISLISSIQDPGEGDTFTHGGAYRWTAEAVGVPGSIQTGNTAAFVVDRTAYPNALWRVTLEVADDDGGVGTFETTLLVGTNGDDQGTNRLIVTDAMFNQAGTTNLMALALDGNDTIDASGVTDSSFSVTLVGGRGVDNLYGGAGDDIYVLAQGNDNANVPNTDVATPVESGNDRYRLRPNSVLTVIDRDGSNTLDFGLADFGITFDLSLNSSTSLVAQDVAPVPLTAPLHIVQTQGSFTQLEGSSFADRFTGASNASIFGGAGNDEFEVKAGTSGASFFGGADADVLRVTSSNISNLSFGGDAGLDTLINVGSITNLTFGGGADADILQNAGAILGNLDFGGDAGRDLLLNTGSIASLTFSGGADSDIFLNNGASSTSLDFGGDADILLAGAGTIGNLVFEGDAGADTFVNLGAITNLTFAGGADNDVFINNGTLADSLNFGGDADVLLVGAGTIGTLSFGGDSGADSLINRGSMGTLTFTGGADADLLRNTGTISNLNFGGDAGFDTLINAGSVVNLTFGGGADADVLLNSGTIIGNLSFGGDAGADSLTNSGGIASLVFTGGADADFLQNTGSISDLNFGGDAGLDSLINQGSIVSLTFGGGADADVLQNNAAGTITGLVFTGDAGLDSLVNLGAVGQLTFGGGADADVLRNVGSIGDLNFGGDAGSDLLVNEGAVTSLTFTGGADNDLLINAGTVLVDLNFGGDAGLDTLVNAGGLANLTFTGGADTDVLKNSGTVSGNLVFGGDGGVDSLLNTGSTASLTFNGGADADVLTNTGTVLEGLVFGGDLGADLLTNTGTVHDLTFTGGADADVLKNSGTIAGDLVFNGDGGADLLVNRGAVGELVFNGGADNDLFLNTATVGSLTFNGGADADVLQNDGVGLASLVFQGGADNDLLLNNGNNIESLVFEGGADNDIFVSNGNAIGSLVFTGDDGVPVIGQASNDTLIVRGSGTGSPTSQIRFDGGYGADAFENNATGFASITFNGGQDADTLLNNARGLDSLNFDGDAGSDVFVNHGEGVISLTFTGGADDDIFLNDGLAVANLTFTGGADEDLLINSGDLLQSLIFTGGADADILVNKGGKIGELVFEGGADADVLMNDGAVIESLVFNGDLGNDRLWNRKGGIQIDSIVFIGDAGLDTLINDAAGIAEITFTGGADADVLQNNGSVIELTFTGGADADVLVNAGQAVSLTFEGGADADILLNRGTQVGDLVFNGDAGTDTLFNLGSVESLVFTGGADADILQNDAAVDSLSFVGDAAGSATLDDGADTLVNNGRVGSLTFTGGGDNDTFQNNANVDSLTFEGGADADVLLNNGPNITSLVFNGDDGADTLINNASGLASLVFNGGADADSLRVQGRDIGTVVFHGGTGTDSFTYNAIGTTGSQIAYFGEQGNDFFAMRGIATTVSFDGGQGDDGVLIVGSGDMTLSGGEGDDFYRFVANPLADVTLTDAYSGVGDVSKDTLDFSSFTGGSVNLDLRLVNVWQAQGTGQLQIRLTDGMSMENIIGTSFADTIYGNARSNYIAGADFDEAFSGPVAAPRGVTQWVLLDFDTHTNSGLIDSVTGLPDAGEHVYTDGSNNTINEREMIRQRVESVYRGPNVGSPWFDLRVVSSFADLPAAVQTSGDFATIYFNQTPTSGRPGGLASEIDPGNANLNGHAVVQVNGLLGGVVSIDEASTSVTPEGDAFGLGSKHKMGCGCPVCMSLLQDQSAGTAKPAGTSENFVLLSSKIAAHELGHLLGLRHQDAFGPIGSGVHDPPGPAGYKPIYTGPSGGVETFDHIIGSPASVGSTRFDDLNELFFGEREAIKLAFANANPSQTTITNSGGNHSQATAVVLNPVTLAVPNTLGRGVNQNKDFFVQITSVLGQIGIDSSTQRSKSDWYSFTGRAGELINIDVLSNSVARFGTGQNGALTNDDYLDTVVRVYNSAGQLVQYYDGLAENDDTFEPTDSSLIDLLLPADGTYFIEVDSFHRFGDAIGDPQNPQSPLNAANPNNILAYPELVDRFSDSINDADTGRYQLIMYKFRKASSSDMIDDLKGFGGSDVIEGGIGDSYLMTANLGGSATLNEGSMFTRTIQIEDRGASDWTGSTVDYGDGSGVQPLSVSSTGQFTLNHVFGDNGSFIVTVSIVNDIGQTLTQQFTATVDNVAPTPSIVSISSTRIEGTSISFTGSATDPAGTNDTLTYIWNFGDGSPAVTGDTATHTFADNGTYVITLTVSDEDGGTTSTTQTITVDNVAPTPSIVSISGNRLEGDLLFFSGAATDPAGTNDTLTYLWNFGDGSPGVFGANPEYFYADNGTYLVTLTVTDEDGGSSSTSQTITIANVAPTATLAGPTSATTGTAVTILATAFDPADAADPLSYQWTITRDGNAFATQTSGPNYSFTPTLGGTYVFTLTVSDDDGGEVIVTHTLTVTATSANTAPTVAISGPGSGVRGHAITYQFVATDPDLVDQNGFFTWTINWGDGSPVQILTGPATISVEHVFVAESAGLYTISAVAKDAANNSSTPATKSVQILVWQVQEDPSQPGTLMLVIGGSAQSERIRLTRHGYGSSAYYKLRIDQEDSDHCDDDEENEYTVRIYSNIAGVIINAQNGNDRIELQTGLNIWSILNGGKGNDRVKAGDGANILIGGDGDDRLEGQKGRDLLIGGRGSDKIDGGKDDDLLIAGFTQFDDNREALLAIMKEWNSSDSFTTRRSQLMGTTPGSLSGSYLLKPSGTTRTIFDDNAVDELWGGEGRDWFLLNMNSAENSRVDKIKDWRNGDEDDDINLF